jgi:hypothetical protein
VRTVELDEGANSAVDDAMATIDNLVFAPSPPSIRVVFIHWSGE